MNIDREPENLTVSPESCIAANYNEPCGEPATMREPVLLCDEHKVQVAALVVPSLLASALAEVRAANEGGTRAVSPADAHLIASAQSADTPEDDRHGVLVYFLANGGRVKVGFTKGLAKRLSGLSLRADAVLLLLHGGRGLEQALHAKFDAYRIGDSEWFELSPEIVRFIASKNPQLGARSLTSKKAPIPSTRILRAGGHDRDLLGEARTADANYLVERGRHIPAERLAAALRIGKPAALELVKKVRNTQKATV